MCNPRRVMVHLDRCIQEAWRQTAEQTARATAQVTELAQVVADVRLDEEMGDMALEMLECVLAGEFEGIEPWRRNDRGQFQRDLDNVTMIYDPKTHRLAVEAKLAEQITSETRAAAEACGVTIGQVAADAVAHYFDDGWGGRTEAKALEDARMQAEKQIAQAVEALHRQQHAAELDAAKNEARAVAQSRAAEELERLQVETRGMLRDRLQVTLGQVQERVAHTMNRVVGEAYRQTLRQLVQRNGGRILVDEQTGSIVNMELELY